MKTTLCAMLITAAALLSGCANIDFDETYAENFEWAAQSAAADIALDYYKMRTRSSTQLTTMHVPTAWSFGTIDPRVLEHYEKALITKGLAPEHISHIRNGNLVVGMKGFAAYAAWGRPREISNAQYRGVNVKQYQYGTLTAKSGSANALKYAHISNGEIIAVYQ